MYTIDHAEQALRQCRQDERTLLRYNIAVLRELCAKNGIEVDGGSSRPLKKPYIKALLSHSQGSHKNTEQTGLKIRLPYFLPINKKRTIDDAEDRNRKRQRGSEEPSAMAVDTPDISHGTTPAIPKSPRIDTVPALTGHPAHIPAANAAPVPEPASQPSTTAIPSKRPYPFGGDKARKRKKKKTGGFINVRIYAERKDVDHTHEIQCALTPDGGLNLVSLSRTLNLTACQASRVDVVPIFGLSAHCLPKVLDARYSRPWVGKHPVLERGAIKLLKAKEGYLRVVGQAPPPLRDQEPSRFPSWQS
ncbi:hypothetical protein EDB85DRAFT_1898423 [Lactarius pseudohatsudake]|nr:hypothetical protein EDB85DRAFT_1898423 [Lactarius pseudohatsudake]